MALQMIPVMVGVYLGFLVSDWSDARNRKAQSELLIENIQSEINRNKKQLDTVFEYHKILRDSSRYYFDNEVTITNRPPYFKGTRTGSLVGSAYNTGIQTGIINELPINMIQSLNRLYNAQENYNDFSSMVTTSFINKKFSNDPEDLREIVRFLSMTMTDIVIKEQELMDGYTVIGERLAK